MQSTNTSVAKTSNFFEGNKELKYYIIFMMFI